MDIKNYAAGIQHIGIPTSDIESTIVFYEKLGFESAYDTVNEGGRVVFLKLNDLVIETYESSDVKRTTGSIDHVAINVTDIEAVWEYINEADLNSTKDTIHFLPFWENGVRYFTIEGPNHEKVEFSQYL